MIPSATSSAVARRNQQQRPPRREPAQRGDQEAHRERHVNAPSSREACGGILRSGVAEDQGWNDDHQLGGGGGREASGHSRVAGLMRLRVC